MRPALVLTVLCTLLARPAFAQKEFGFDNTKPSGQPYLAPEETVRRMKVAPEFEVKLFAGEPMLANPIAFTIDERGRVWAVECFEYPSKTPKGKKPRDRIVILEDTDGDGVADKRTVFAEGKDFPEGFDLASGIEVGHGGVFLGAPPYLWFIENKDDKPGKFEILLKGFGSQDTHETLNTFQWGPDGWLYGLHGVFTQSTVKPLDGPETRMNAAVWRYHPKTKKFEIFAEGTSNPWGMDWRNTDGQFILCCCVIPHLFHMVPGGTYKRQAGASFNPYSYGQIDEICDHTFHKESGWAHAGLISLDVPHMPEKYRNSVIFGSIHGCSVKQNVLKPNGSTYTASRGDDFLVSGDKNFRPINMKWGPLGDIYLIDWHDQNPCHQAKADAWDYERGRVYRIQLKGTQPKKAEDLGKKTPVELVAMRDDPNPYRYRTALRLLAGFDRESRVAAAEAAIARKTPTEYTLRDWEAMLYLTHGKPPAITGGPLVGDWSKKTAAEVEWLVRVAAQGDWEDEKPMAALTKAAAQAKSETLRRELASAAIRLADKHDVRPLVHALMKRAEDRDDPVIRHLVWLAYEKVLANRKAAGTDGKAADDADEFAWLAKNAAGNPFVTGYVLPRAVRRVASSGKPADLGRCVALIAGLEDAQARQVALAGFAAALQGQTFEPPPGWAKLRADLVAGKDPNLVAVVDRLDVTFRDPRSFRRVVTAAGNPRLSAADRAEAVRQLAQLQHPDSVKVLLGLTKGEGAETVRVEAVRALASFPDRDIPPALVTGWGKFPPAVRAEAVNTLAGRKEWAAALLSAMKEGIIARTAVTDTTITRIQAFKDRTLNNLIEEAWGRTRATPAELQATIDKLRTELASAPGSFARGKKVFADQCAKCHKFEGVGSDVGPQLDGAGRDIEYLLANVLDPNRVIGAPYFIRQAALADGQVIQGVLAEEDDRTLTLKVENGVLKKIVKADLDGPVKVLEKSMMPEGLAATMTVQDFRDLVRYVMAHPYPAAVAVNDAPVKAAVNGFVPLPEMKEAGAATVAFAVTAPAAVKTQLLVGSRDPFEVLLDGKVVGSGKGTGGKPEPDREAVPVELSKGAHTVAVRSKYSGGGRGVFARLLDPDRKLMYPEAVK